MPNSWQLHELQHARLPCPSSPLSQWCSLTISSSVSPLFSCPQSSPASGSFPVSRLFTLGGQSIGVSASVLPMNIHSWFPLGLTGLISLQQSKGLSRVLLQHQSSKVSILQRSTFFMVQLSHPYMTTGKTIARFVIAFLPRSKLFLWDINHSTLKHCHFWPWNTSHQITVLP